MRKRERNVVPITASVFKTGLLFFLLFLILMSLELLIIPPENSIYLSRFYNLDTTKFIISHFLSK